MYACGVCGVWCDGVTVVCDVRVVRVVCVRVVCAQCCTLLIAVQCCAGMTSNSRRCVCLSGSTVGLYYRIQRGDFSPQVGT